MSPRSRHLRQLVRSCLAPDGRVFLIDNRDDHPAPHGKDPYVVKYGPDLHLPPRRRLRVPRREDHVRIC